MVPCDFCSDHFGFGFTTLHSLITVFFLSCLRSAVLGCYITEQLFLENDGVFHLMDLLEVLNRSVFKILAELVSYY